MKLSRTVEQEGRTQMQNFKFNKGLFQNAGEKRTKRKLNSTKKLGKQRENNKE